MERESFIFYRSFYDSIKGLGDAEFAECMRFLCEYGLNGAEQTGGTLAEVVLKMRITNGEQTAQRAADQRQAPPHRSRRYPIGKPMVLRRKTIGYGMQNLM